LTQNLDTTIDHTLHLDIKVLLKLWMMQLQIYPNMSVDT